ncbi:TauD/TfdA family dioxygenase [Altererythrobacter sp. CC-YST694]|nr:TauD/TfdA family dioxygenase [Altererythrobacter sp. CC-YST694]
MLLGCEVPPSGGNTVFASMYAARDDLPAGLKREADIRQSQRGGLPRVRNWKYRNRLSSRCGRGFNRPSLTRSSATGAAGLEAPVSVGSAVRGPRRRSHRRQTARYSRRRCVRAFHSRAVAPDC